MPSICPFYSPKPFKVITLKCPVKQYDWGKVGSDSLVAKILKQQNEPVDESLPYAEVSKFHFDHQKSY